MSIFPNILPLFLSPIVICQQLLLVVINNRKVPGGQSFLASIQNLLIFAVFKSSLNLNLIRHWSENWCPGHLKHALSSSEIHFAVAKSLEIIGHETNCSKRPIQFVLAVHLTNQLCVGESSIVPVTSVKNLGSWFDKNMSMTTHIIKVCKAASFHLYNIRRIRKYLTSESTHCLVRATVIGRIDYCNSLLFKIPAVHIAKLQRIQNSAARLVYYIPRFEHITPVLYRLHWLPVSFRIEYKVLILTYKAIHGLAPPYISDLIRTRERTNYNLRSSSQLLLQPYNVTKTKKTLGDRAFQVASPGLWNSLPNDIRNAKTMDVFKSLVKTYLFRKAYACYF